MSFDGQVLVIAFFAVALKLYLWSREAYVVRVDVEPERKEVLHLDGGGQRLRAEARPDGTEGIVATSLRPRLEGDRYV
jgi:hypothetical protein